VGSAQLHESVVSFVVSRSSCFLRSFAVMLIHVGVKDCGPAVTSRIRPGSPSTNQEAVFIISSQVFLSSHVFL
jgi:hypothetical protein